MVTREGGIHVGRDLRHLVGREDLRQVEVARLAKVVRQLGRIVVDPERALKVERAAVTVGECDVTRGMNGADIEQGAEDDPPVEEVVDVTSGHVERCGREERHRRPAVVDDVGDLVHVEAHRGVPSATGVNLDGIAVDRQRPGAGRRLDRERPDAQLASARDGQRRAFGRQAGQLGPEEVRDVDRLDVDVVAGPEVDRHDRPG